MPEFAVIVPAAGRSSRFGGPVNKLMEPLAGRPVLAWTLGAFAARRDVREIVVATGDPDAIERCTRWLDERDRGKVRCCSGGASRAESVGAGARASSANIEWLAVHDAARPLVSGALIDRTLAAAVAHGAAAAALAVHLTIKQAEGPLPAAVQRTVSRHNLWAMQTPQIMRRGDFLEALAACPIPLDEVTDDVQLLELCGKPVWLVEGEQSNLKITTPIDLQIAQALLKT